VLEELARYCGQCGAEARSGIRFCESCGHPLDAAVRPAQESEPPPVVEWTCSFPLATSRFLLWDTLKLLVWTGLILYLILAGIGLFAHGAGAAFLATAGMIAGLCMAGFGFLFLAIMLIFFGNRYTARFAVSRRGVAYATVSRRARLSSRAAIVAGVLAGSAQTAGAGLLAASRESGRYSWADLRSVKEYPAHCVLSLCNSWRCVLRLYCSPENYAMVRDLVRAYLPAGTVWREGTGRRASALLRGLAIALAASLATGNGSLSLWVAGGCALLAVAGILEGAAATLLAVLGCAGVAVEAVRIFAQPGNIEWYRLVPALAGLLGAAAFAFAVLRPRRAQQAAVAAILLAALACAPLRAAQDTDPGRGFNFFSEAEERSLGQRYVAELDRQLKLVRDPQVTAEVERVGRKLASASPRRFEFRFAVVDTREVNAFAVPGGYIYVNRGLIELAGSEDELAGVLAHEIGHVTARHATREMSKRLVWSAIVGGASALAATKSRKWGDIIAYAGGAGLLFGALKYSRNDEYQADAIAVDLLARNGYSPYGLLQFFDKIGGQGGRPSRWQGALAIVNTHPPTPDRVARLRPRIAELGLAPTQLAAGPEFLRIQEILKVLPLPDAQRDVTLSGALAATDRRLGQASQDPALPAPPEWAESVAIAVPGNTVWLSTGIRVNAGDRISLAASGVIQPIKKDRSVTCGPDGIPGTRSGFFKPVSSANTGALVARVRGEQGQPDSSALVAGSLSEWQAPVSGLLELGINDDNNFDNLGEFRVLVAVRRARQP
jgi:Zn-dependent protease with chaperone function